jgi:hypothetical protein
MSRADNAIAARNAARAERDAAVTERDAARAERDNAVAAATRSAFERAPGPVPVPRVPGPGARRAAGGRSTMPDWVERAAAWTALAIIVFLIATMVRGLL